MTEIEKHMENSRDFRRKLFEIQDQVKFIQTNARGQFAFLNYYGLMNKLYPLLKERGLYMSFTSCEYSKTMVCLIEDVESGSSKECRAPFPEEAFDNKNAMASYGKKITYIRRYLICMLFNIVTADDNGDSFGEVKEVPKPRAKPDSKREALMGAIVEAVNKTGLQGSDVTKIINDNITKKYENKTKLNHLNEAELAFVLVRIKEIANGGSK